MSDEFAGSMLTDDYLLQVLQDQLQFYYGLAGTFDVQVLSFNVHAQQQGQIYDAMLCVDRSKVALLVNAMTFFMPNKNDCGILAMRTIRKSPYLHSMSSTNSRSFFQKQQLLLLDVQ